MFAVFGAVGQDQPRCIPIDTGPRCAALVGPCRQATAIPQSLRVDAGGRIYLSGVDEDVNAQLQRPGKLDLKQEVHIVPENAIIGASTAEAVAQADAWLGSMRYSTLK